MSDKNLYKGIAIGVTVTLIIVVAIYAYGEFNKLKEKNELLLRKVADESNPKIIHLPAIPLSHQKETGNAIDNSANMVLRTYTTALKHIHHLKDRIENRDAYRIFHNKNRVVEREKDVHALFDMTFVDTHLSIDKEVNNGRGQVDFKISNGNGDKTIVEFKLGSSRQLKRNLQNQTEIYSKANDKAEAITVIVFTTEKQEVRIKRILTELSLAEKENVVLIDARKDNKPSGSKAA